MKLLYCKKAIAMLLALLMLILSFPAGVLSVSANDEEDDDIATSETETVAEQPVAENNSDSGGNYQGIEPSGLNLSVHKSVEIYR